MGRLAITISTDGIQTLSFFGNTEEERSEALKIYSILEEELRVIDRLVKQRFAEVGGESQMENKTDAKKNEH